MDAVTYALAGQALQALENDTQMTYHDITENVPRSSVALASLGNAVLMVGGLDTNSNVRNSADVYDNITGTWTTVASAPYSADSMAAVGLGDGKALIAGGDTAFGTYPTSSVALYDRALNTWTLRTSMPTARTNAGAALLSGGRVLVVGGDEKAGTSRKAELYNVASNSWVTRSSMAESRTNFGLCSLTNDHVLAIGGYGSGATSLEDYDDGTNTWTKTTIPFTGHTIRAVTLKGDRVLVVGGYQAPENLRLRRYDPSTGDWVDRPNMREGGWPEVTVMDSGEVVIMPYGGNRSASYKMIKYVDTMPNVERLLATIRAWAATQ